MQNRIDFKTVAPDGLKALSGLEVFQAVRKHFSDKELVDLTLVVTVINAWNRMAISFRRLPGSYQPARAKP